MLLVDTSVWIDYIRGKKNQPTTNLNRYLDQGIPVVITSFVLQEVLQGAESRERFNQFKTYLSSLPIAEPLHRIDSFAAAAMIYYNCRRKGITLRSTIDCLLAQIAIEQQLILLHNDHDFNAIAKVAPELKIVKT